LIHEYAHALLHFHVDDDTERSKREVEAEAVAYDVGRYCGLDTSRSAFYLAAWESDDPEIVRDRVDRISRTVEEFISVLETGATDSTYRLQTNIEPGHACADGVITEPANSWSKAACCVTPPPIYISLHKIR